MTLIHLRPENRERRAPEPPPWQDTVPLLHRSEAFPEDLPVLDDPVALVGAAGGAESRFRLLPFTD